MYATCDEIIYIIINIIYIIFDLNLLDGSRFKLNWIYEGKSNVQHLLRRLT
jgi:hypothetical protein